jgi:hypothetical protein
LALKTGNAGGIRPCIPNERTKWFYHFNFSSYGRRAKRAGGEPVRSRNVFLAMWSLQFAKAGSAATISQQENNNPADVQRDRVNTTGFI